MPNTQAGQFISVTTPLGDDVLVLQKFTGQETISQLFKFQLELVSEKPPIRLESIIGQNVTINMTLSDGRKRYFNGFVSQFAQTGGNSQFTYYQAQVVPWLWFLGQTSDCRIFQNKSVPDIVMQVFQEFGFHDFRRTLQSTYEPREVVIQHRETGLNFISRLLEQVGIFYFFEHEQGKHTLVMADNLTAHPVLPATPSLPYRPSDVSGAGDGTITRLALKREWRPGKYAMNDYNFENPSTSLEVASASTPEVGGNRRYEQYEHPGDYRRKAEGEVLARIRLQEIESISQVVHGTSSSRAMAAGYRFTLTGHFRREFNRDYLITHVHHDAEVGNQTNAAVTEKYRNEFTSIPHSTPFRPLRITPQPVVRGPETGVVVGPKKEEVFVDEYGRVKVQFHWDRQANSDENSSGWIRVGQPWAGKQWGALLIPRVGDEVLVEFLHGDVNRPVVIGSLYNGAARPPVSLPPGQTTMTIKSNSTKGGGGSNEIRFDDKKGSEEIYVHGQKNARTVIEHDQFETIGNNQTLTVGSDRSEIVGKAQVLTIGAGFQLSVGATMNERVGSNKQVHVGGTLAEAIGRELSLTIGTDGRFAIGRNLGVDAGNSITMAAKKRVSVSAGDELVLKCGQASIVLKKNGDITITGKAISVKAAGDLVLRGRKILEN